MRFISLRATLAIENNTYPSKIYPKAIYVLVVVFRRDLYSDHFFS